MPLVCLRSKPLPRLGRRWRGDWAAIGDVRVPLVARASQARPELVPRLSEAGRTDEARLAHLQWMLRKDVLGQDMFLLGPPGQLRRQLAFDFAAVTRRGVEYSALTRDSTEADLKQRRELVRGTMRLVNQGAIRAALEGHLLVLEGIERAERNVLPILNNLLENREVNLEDGHRLIAPARYDELLRSHPKTELDAWRLLRVSERFRVVALGLPCPPFPGAQLDPPFRSRFQVRYVDPLDVFDNAAELERAQTRAPGVPQATLSNLVNLQQALLVQASGYAVSAETKAALAALGANTVPELPESALGVIASRLQTFPRQPLATSFAAVYPHQLKEEAHAQLLGLAQRFHLTDAVDPTRAHATEYRVSHVQRSSSISHLGEVAFEPAAAAPFAVPVGQLELNRTLPDVLNSTRQAGLVSELVQAHATGDICAFGGRSTGKSTVVNAFAALLGYEVAHIPCYKEMSARDLLVRRTTVADAEAASTAAAGDTRWMHSPLVTAALKGQLAVLDGVDQLSQGTLASLQTFWATDRFLELPDGSRLLGAGPFEAARSAVGPAVTEAEMAQRGVYKIHPSFRAVLIGGEPTSSAMGGASAAVDQAQTWLTQEVAQLFQFVHFPAMTSAEESELVRHLAPGCPPVLMDALVKYAATVRSSEAATDKSLHLTTRQMVRIAKRLARQPQDSVRGEILKATLWPFLPMMARNNLIDVLNEAAIGKSTATIQDRLLVPVASVDGKDIVIGTVKGKIYEPTSASKALVPSIVYHDNPQHSKVLQEMLVDFEMGEHLLLIGNQGVGKNKLADRFLQLLNRPREYIQLHRDTTVQSIMVHPSVQNGRIIYGDAPLVRAAKLGHVLVIDEADKAPVHVTAALKSLAETGEFPLSDGRYIRRFAANEQVGDVNAVPLHPDFRLIVLANRPGFPFLGNDFYATVGDVFAAHTVENPDASSELYLLRKEAPNVSWSVLQRLIGVFGELRAAFTDGLVSYPYSLRELVAIVRHLNAFPHDSFRNALKNVFDFDALTKDFEPMMLEILRRHGFPITSLRETTATDAKPDSALPVKLADVLPLKVPTISSSVGSVSSTSDVPASPALPFKIVQGPGSGRKLEQKRESSVAHFNARIGSFSEHIASWSIPRIGRNMVAAATTGTITDDNTFVFKDIVDNSPVVDLSQEKPALKASMLHVAVTEPVVLHSFRLSPSANVPVSSVSSDLTEAFGYNGSQGCVHLQAYGDQGHVAVFAPAVGTIAFVDTEGAIARVWKVTPPSSAARRLPSSSSASSSPSSVATFGNLIKSGDQFVLDFGLSHAYVASAEDFEHGAWVDLGGSGVDALSALTDDSFCVPTSDLLRFKIASGAAGSSVQSIALNQPVRLAHHAQFDSLPLFEGSPLPSSIHDVSSTALVVDSTHSLDLLIGHKSSADLSLASYAFPIESAPPSGASRTTVHTSKDAPLVVRATDASALHAIDLNSGTYKQVALPPVSLGSVASFLKGSTNRSPLVVPITGSPGSVAVVSLQGGINVYQLVDDVLHAQLKEWTRLEQSGEGAEGDDKEDERFPGKRSGLKKRLRLLLDSEDAEVEEASSSTKDKPLGGPKHGEEDNEEHHGGNNFAGGTGGRDTAGMGGIGGPYRIDKGNKVFQVPDSEKARVPKDVLDAARAMGKEALQARLKHIGMNDTERDMYLQLLQSVSREVQQLRVIFKGAQAKEQERVWLRNRTDGELDDNKLCDGLAGESAIYKRRGFEDQNPGQYQHPKRFRFVTDLSASMYRFDGMDGRLERSMAAVVLLMEALDGVDPRRITYEITGHSGDSSKIALVPYDHPPAHIGERAKVVLQMLAHAQYTWSGDNTLPALKKAVDEVAKEEADERIVVLLSDANLDRYGIRPKAIADVMKKHGDKVRTYVLFVGSLGDQADDLVKALPRGQAFILTDPNQVPRIFQAILASHNK